MSTSQESPAVLLLHASAVLAPSGALLFLGHAGAGKSTVRQLLAGRYPPLADEAVMLVRNGDAGWRVGESDSRVLRDLSSNGDLVALSGPPVRAVLRVVQDSEPRLDAASPRMTCRYLTDAFFEVLGRMRVPAARARSMFSLAAEVARQHNGWELHTTADSRTAEVIFKIFDGGAPG